ncbi:MAG: tyrosine-type recombinase/integrase [Candidatus Dormibacteraceae bacterium]
MRSGRVFRRCSKCGGRVAVGGRACAKCGSETFSWSFVVDVAPKGQTRRQRSKAGFVTKAEAVGAMNLLQTEKKDGTHVEPSAMTLATYLERWLQGAEVNEWEANTVRDYTGSVRRHIIPRIGQLPLQDITTDDLRAFYGQLLKEGKSSRRRGDDSRAPLSRKSVQNVHIALRSALQDAFEADPPLIRRNPAVPRGKKKAFTYTRSKNRTEMKTWTTEEIQQFLDFTASDRESPLYRTALMTGMRRGELLGLRRKDLDLRSKRLQVRQQYARDGEHGLRIKGLKTDTKSWRDIDLDDVTVEALRGQLEAQAFERNAWKDGYKDQGLVFCNPDGSPLDVDSVTRRFERRTAAAGVQVIRFHDQRHTHATLLLENDVPLKAVAERLGDREDTVLEIYSHVTSKMRKNTVSRLATLIDGPRLPPEIGALRAHSVRSQPQPVGVGSASAAI